MLIKNGINVKQMINFGQPRVGDQIYANLSQIAFPNQLRVVHH
jgi:Lipase (class 3)